MYSFNFSGEVICEGDCKSQWGIGLCSLLWYVWTKIKIAWLCATFPLKLETNRWWIWRNGSRSVLFCFWWGVVFVFSSCLSSAVESHSVITGGIVIPGQSFREWQDIRYNWTAGFFPRSIWCFMALTREFCPESWVVAFFLCVEEGEALTAERCGIINCAFLAHKNPRGQHNTPKASKIYPLNGCF